MCTTPNNYFVRILRFNHYNLWKIVPPTLAWKALVTGYRISCKLQIHCRRYSARADFWGIWSDWCHWSLAKSRAYLKQHRVLHYFSQLPQYKGTVTRKNHTPRCAPILYRETVKTKLTNEWLGIKTDRIQAVGWWLKSTSRHGKTLIVGGVWYQATSAWFSDLLVIDTPLGGQKCRRVKAQVSSK